MRRLSGVWPNLFALGAVLSISANARAGEELRIKLDLDYSVLGDVSDDFALRPMLQTEQRFRDDGLVLLKVFVGARADLLPWLILQAYYAHKDKFYAEHEEVHMAVLDVILRVDIGPFRVSDRSGNEWHSNPGFYRYRNKLDVHINLGLDWLRLFVADEVRFDSDQAKVNLNDLQAGADVRVGANMSLRAYYDRETNRRSKSNWASTHVLGLMVIGHL